MLTAIGPPKEEGSSAGALVVITTTPRPSPPSNQSSFDLIPAGQLGLDETRLPGQPVCSGPSVINSMTSGPTVDINSANGIVNNGGNAGSGEI